MSCHFKNQLLHLQAQFSNWKIVIRDVAQPGSDNLVIESPRFSKNHRF
jgi:hypothetical protein